MLTRQLWECGGLVKKVTISKIIALSILVLAVNCAQATDKVWSIVAADGQIKLDNSNISLYHYYNNWEKFLKIVPDPGYPLIKDKKWTLQATFGSYRLNQTIENQNNNELLCHYKLSLDRNKAPIKTDSLSAVLVLKSNLYAGINIKVNGNSIKLPVVYKELGVYRNKTVKSITFLTSHGREYTIKGNFGIYIQDNRKYNIREFHVRLLCRPWKGMIEKSELKFTISWTDKRTTAVNIRANANMGFKDAVAGDNKGGWTDQGPSNDLRMFKPGQKSFGGIKFDVITPDSNNGKSCIVLGKFINSAFKKSVDIKLNKQKAQALYLLHAQAWMPNKKCNTGLITVKYSDGSSQQLKVNNRRDVNNWWTPYGKFKNAIICWTGKNKESYVGLYLSRFLIKEKSIESIVLSETGKAVWMIAGISIGDDIPLFPSSNALVYRVANKQWKSIGKIKTWQVKAGSALDFSATTDAPAGKYGHLIAQDGHFEFTGKPGHKVRFAGANICYTANYMNKEQCRTLVDNYSRIGYNAVRLHHFDRYLPKANATKTTVYDKNKIDQLDYLFYSFKEKGVYITIDLYSDRRLKKGEIPEINRAVCHDFKYLVPVLDSAKNNWKEFTKNLLLHKNPYTGLTLGKDPALISICLLNESNLSINKLNTYPDVKNIYDKKFKKWLSKRKITNNNKRALYLEFLNEIQLNNYIYMRDYIRSLGVKTLTTDMNMWNYRWDYSIREEMDYVDNHQYWDHPRFPQDRWKSPFVFNQNSSIESWANNPTNILTSRVIGLPFTMTEVDYCYPNELRAMGAPVIGAYSSLQDCDGIWWFAFSHSSKDMRQPAAINIFDLANDPIRLLGQRILHSFYIRRDVKTASKMIPLLFSDNDKQKMQSPSSNFYKLAMYARVGVMRETELNKKMADKTYLCFLTNSKSKSTVESNKKVFSLANNNVLRKMVNEKILDHVKFNINKECITSSTGQITCDVANDIFKVSTEKSECMVVPSKKLIAGKNVTVKNDDNQQAVLSVIALDNKSIPASKHLLLLHLTDTQNTKMAFQGRTPIFVKNLGELPLLVRDGAAEFYLKTKNTSKNIKVWALNFDGSKQHLINSVVKNNTLTVKTKVFQPDNKICMAYEIIFGQ